MKTIQDLKEKLLATEWIDAEYKNLQETHIYVNLDGDYIYAQYVCVTEGGQMFDCNVFSEAISAEGFLHLFSRSDWFTISLF